MPWLQPSPVRSPMMQGACQWQEDAANAANQQPTDWTKHERRVQWFLMRDTQLFRSFFVKESAAVAVPVMKRRRMPSRSVISAL